MASPPLPLAPRDLLILAALSEGEAHGYGILRRVEHRSPRGVGLDPANLYRSLRRLEREGLVTPSAAEDAGDGEEGDRRRFYRITGAGRRALRAEAERLEGVVRWIRDGLAGDTVG